MLLDEMIAMVRIEANASTAKGRVTDTEIVYYINRAQNLLGSVMVRQDQKFFDDFDDTVNFVADQAEYSLPSLIEDERISLVERLNADGTVRYTVPYLRFQEKERWGESYPHGFDSTGFYYLRGRKIGFRPVPESAETAAVKIYGQQLPHDVMLNTIPATGLTVTAFVIDNTASIIKGRVQIETNYYKNAMIRVITGADAGIERKITAFAPATRTATIDTAWTTANVTGQQYVILSKIPDMHHTALVKYAVAQVAAKTPDTTLHGLASGAFQTVYDSFARTTAQRRSDTSPKHHYPVDTTELC